MRYGLLCLLLSRLLGYWVAFTLCAWQTQPCLLVACFVLSTATGLFVSHIRKVAQQISTISAFLRDSASALVWTYTGTVLLGSSLLSYETGLIAVLLAFEWRVGQLVGFNGHWAVAGAVLAASQLPLDWDFEAVWQTRPYPELTLLSAAQTLGLVAGLLA